MKTLQFENGLICALKANRTLNNAIGIILGSLLLVIASQITLPFQPVPMTLQTFAVFLISAIFGPKTGGKVVFTYLCEGACGLPVFANFSGGVSILLGPTGGYLLGFLPATILIGYLLQMSWVKSRMTILLAATLGNVVLFICGYLVLAKFVGFVRAYQFGIEPFYLVEIVKLAVFVFIAPVFLIKVEHDHI